MRNTPGINGKEQHDKYGNHPFFKTPNTIIMYTNILLLALHQKLIQQEQEMHSFLV